MKEIIYDKIYWFDEYIAWGVGMIIFLLGTHVFLTIKTRFIQRKVFKGIKESLKNDGSKKGNLSVFGSLVTALSSTIGTGNIIGVGTALVLGGPGAILWTWVGGFFGIATKYAESYMAIKYRHRHSNNEVSGGAMYVFERFNMPGFAKAFAILCSLCAFGIGCATQSGAIADTLYENFGINQILTGIVLCVLTAIVVFGGIKSIARVCEKLVPIMGFVYIIGCVVILVLDYKYIPEAFSLIISSAFTTKAAAGGFVGSSIRYACSAGIARGLFSNESGMGSAPQATAASSANNAVKPALVGSTGVFWDTIIVCMLSGLVLVTSVISNDAISCFLADGSVISSASLVSKCFSQVPIIGTPLLVFGILTFAYSTILGWSYYGENTSRYLFGHLAIPVYRVLWIIMIFVGAYFPESIIWSVANILNAAMCIPNVIAVLMTHHQMVDDTNYYLYENHLDEIDKTLE